MSQVVAAHGEASLEAVEIRNGASGATTREPSGGLYILIGADAETRPRSRSTPAASS